MPLRMEVGLGPGDFVFDGDPSSPIQKGAEYPFFGPCVLWPKGWMDQDGTWHGGGFQSRPLCARWGPPQKKRGGGTSHPHFFLCLLWPRSPISATFELFLLNVYSVVTVTGMAV